MAVKNNSKKFIIFNAVGNPDKELAGTAVVANIKIKYPEELIVVVSNHPEIWLHNEDVYRVYKIGQVSYFFEDYIENKESRIFWQDPFNTDDSFHKRKNLMEIWSNLCKVPFKINQPKMRFTFREIEATERMMSQKISLNLRQSLCADYLKNKK